MTDNLLMAQAFGDAIGAPKRRVQFLTDHGALRCVGEKHPKRGRQRLYDEAEIPIGKLIAQMAAFELPIGRLIWTANEIRNQLKRGTTAPPQPGGFSASWHREALAGKRESYILLRPDINNLMWVDRKGMNRQLDVAPMIVIPVHEVVKRVLR
jgi:hypothetical protein